MIRINSEVTNYLENISKIEYNSKYTIVECNDKKYLLKYKNNKLKEIEEYLNSIEYDYYVSIINSYDDNIYIYPYYDSYDISLDDKYEDIINALSILHIKSCDHVFYNKDEMKVIYDDISSKIDYMMKYYYDLQDYIEELSFPRPALYLLINNISKFHELLKCARFNLDTWYKEESFKSICCLLINNLELDNFIVGEKNYFINFDNSYRDLFIYDLVNFYKSNYSYENIVKVINKYEKRLGIRNNEYNLFFSLISIPDKIDITNNNIKDIKMVNERIEYVSKTLKYILEKDEENKKTDKYEFED